MTRKAILVAVAMLVIGVAIGGALTVLASSPQQQGVSQERQEWEYRVTQCFDLTSCSRTLNYEGENAYELVSALFDGSSVTLFMKRPK